MVIIDCSDRDDRVDKEDSIIRLLLLLERLLFVEEENGVPDEEDELVMLMMGIGVNEGGVTITMEKEMG